MVIMAGCKVGFSLSGASIHQDAETFSVAYFNTTSPLVSPMLSPNFTEALQAKFADQTRLREVREDGDFAFEGEIVGYNSTSTAVTAEEFATRNRLTVTVKVKFTNRLEPEFDFNKNFSAYEEYDSSEMLVSAEPRLIPAIVEKLVDDIFNAAVSNW